MRHLRVLCVAAALARAQAVSLGVVQNLVFAALSDWGGQAQMPFTTPGQLAAAAALGRVADTQRPKLVVSAGGNFLPQGLPGTAPRLAARPRPPAGRPLARAPRPECRPTQRAAGCAHVPWRLGARSSVFRLTRHIAPCSRRAVAEQPDPLRGHV